MQVGQIVLWDRTVSNYGHIHTLRAKILKIGKRITIETEGGRRTVVRAENLREADG